MPDTMNDHTQSRLPRLLHQAIYMQVAPIVMAQLFQQQGLLWAPKQYQLPQQSPTAKQVPQLLGELLVGLL